MSKVADFFSYFHEDDEDDEPIGRKKMSVGGAALSIIIIIFILCFIFSGYNHFEFWFPEYIFDFLTHEEILCMIFGTSSTLEIVWAFAVGVLSAAIYLLSRYIKKESEISYVDLVFLFVLSTLLTFRIYYTIIFAYNCHEIKPKEVIQTTIAHKYRCNYKTKRGRIYRVSNDIIFYVDGFIAHKEIEDYEEFGNYNVGDTINVEISIGCLGYPTSVKNLKIWKYGEGKPVEPIEPIEPVNPIKPVKQKPLTPEELKNKRVPHLQSICGVTPGVLNHYYIHMNEELKEVNLKVFGCINDKFKNSPKDVNIVEIVEFVALSDGTITDIKVTDMSMRRDYKDIMVNNSKSALLKAVRGMDKWEPVLLVETNRPEKTRVCIKAYYHRGKMQTAEYEMYDIAAEDEKYFGQKWEY